MSPTFQEKTTADNKSIGFDYQYYYFLLLLLDLKEGQQIGIEVKDDVHIDLQSGEQILIQLKHTVQTKVTNTPINLTERDADLWKSIYNWINIICDKTEGRDNDKEQLDYIAKTKFVLVSNKQNNTTNKFLVNVSKFKNKELGLAEFIDYLQKLYDETETDCDSEHNVKNYIMTLLKLDSKILEKFINKLSFNLGEDDLVSAIKSKLKEKVFEDNRIDDVFDSLNSNLRIDNYITVKKREKIVIDFESFRRKYKNCFSKGRIEKLPIRKGNYIVPENPESQVFVKQLININIVSKEQIDKINKYTTYKLMINNNFEQWIHEGDITPLEKDEFDRNSKLLWESSFALEHLESQEILESNKLHEEKIKLIIKNAQRCYFSVIKEYLELNGTKLDLELSNGQFYLLSDKLYIGWEFNWEEKYK